MSLEVTYSRTLIPHDRDSWLEIQQRKKSRYGCICWSFWIGFFVLTALIVVVVLVLIKTGIMADFENKIESVTSPPPPNPTNS